MITIVSVTLSFDWIVYPVKKLVHAQARLNRGTNSRTPAAPEKLCTRNAELECMKFSAPKISVSACSYLYSEYNSPPCPRLLKTDYKWMANTRLTQKSL